MRKVQRKSWTRAKGDFLREAVLFWAGADPERDLRGHLVLPQQHAQDTDLGCRASEGAVSAPFTDIRKRDVRI